MKNNYTGMVFIHGAGLGSFIWDGIKPMMKYPILAIDFPNRNGGDKVNLDLSLKDYSDSIIEKIEKWNVEKLIIVTHSIGGCVGLKVAEYFGNRVNGFVAISAAIPKDGNSYLSCLPFSQMIITKLILRLMGTAPPESIIIKSLCNDLDADQSKQIVEKFTPESKALYFDKCEAKIPGAKKLYVKLLKDKSFSPLIQDNFIKNLNPQEIADLASGHLPMYSQPKQLADILNNFTGSC